MTKNLLSNSMKIFMLAVLCLAFGIIQIAAQSTVTGAIGGKVTDPQGAVVPNATVTATNTGTNQSVTVTADEDGGFRLANLQPGTYTVKATGTGFAEFTQQAIVVEVGQITSINVPLNVSGASANVTVTAETPVINTNDNANATNVNQTSINNLPISGRRASNFVLLTPATVPDGTFGLISFRGISGLLNNSTVDGGDNNQAFFSEERGRTRINYSISQSAIREFQVNGSNYSAEYGRAAGGVVNTVTKSGTNDFHGEAFYYNRNNRNGARNPLAFQNTTSGRIAIKPPDLRQQFGGAIGGPIFKDHLFFFFSYDQQKRNFPGIGAFTSPTFLNGIDATTLRAKGVTDAQIASASTFLTSLTGETPRRGDQKLYLPKIDWQINGNNLFSATYNRLRWASPAGIQTQTVNNLGRRSFGDDFVKTDSVNLRLQSTLSANMLNEARLQYSRDFEFETSQTPLPGEPLTSTTSQGPRTPNVSLTNGLSFGTPTFLERGKYPDERRIQFADTVTYTLGKNTIKFGGDINRVTDDTTNLRTQAGSYSYSTINDFILDYTNYQNSLTPAGPQIVATTTCPTTSTPQRAVGRCYNGNFIVGVGIQGLKIRTNDYNFFAQDDIRVTPRLTVNLGLRYEYERMPKVVLPNTGTLYSNTIIPNVNRTFADATSYMPNDKNNFGPRFGFAYDLFGDGKTSIRGGYGIYYGRIINSTIYNTLLNTGNPNGQFQISLPSTSLTSPIFPQVPVPSTASITSATTPPGAIQFFQRGFQAPLINQYDAILEHELTKNTVVSVSYLGSLGRHLPTFVDQNFLQSSATTRNITVNGGPFAGRTFTTPFYSRAFGTQAITEVQSTVSSEYNAIVFQANRRFTDGLQFQSSYTLAKSTDTNQTSQTFTATNSPINLFDRSRDAGPSNFDVRHKVVISAVYAPTFYKGDSKSLYNYLLNGYSIAPIFAYYSGSPYNGTISASATTGNNGGINGTGGDSRFPLVGRNYFRLPSIKNVDLRVSKRFKFTENTGVEVLAEGFNIFNRTQIFGVNTLLYTQTTSNVTASAGLGSCAQGTVASTANPVLCFNQTGGIPNFQQATTTFSTIYNERQIQLSARFQF